MPGILLRSVFRFFASCLLFAQTGTPSVLALILVLCACVGPLLSPFCSLSCLLVSLQGQGSVRYQSRGCWAHFTEGKSMPLAQTGLWSLVFCSWIPTVGKLLDISGGDHVMSVEPL